MSFIPVDETGLDLAIAGGIAEGKIEEMNWVELFKLPVQHHPVLLRRFFENLEKQDYKKFDAWYTEATKYLLSTKTIPALQNAINQAPQAERLSLIFCKHWEMDGYIETKNLLHHVTESQYSALKMRAVFEFIPQDMLPYIDIVARLFDQEEKLSVYLSMLSELGRWILFNLVDKNRDRTLHHAASYPAAFKKILALEKNDDARRRALLATNNHQVSVLQCAASCDESLELAFSLIPEEERYNESCHRSKSGRQLIHFANTAKNMLRILNVIPAEHQFQALISKPGNHESAIVMACRNVEWLKAVLGLFDRSLWPVAMRAAGEAGHKLVKELARQPEKMLEVLSFYQINDRLTAVPLDELVNADPKTIIDVMNLLTADDKIGMLTKRTADYHHPFLARYALFRSTCAMHVLEEGLSDDAERAKAVRLAGGKIILHATTHSMHLPFFNRIFCLFPEGEREELFSGVYYNYGNELAQSVARSISGNHEWIKAALLLMPPQQRLKALCAKVYGRVNRIERSLLNQAYGTNNLAELTEILLLLPILALPHALKLKIRSYSQKRGYFDEEVRDAYMVLRAQECATISLTLLGSDDINLYHPSRQKEVFEAVAACVVLARANNAKTGHPIERIPADIMKHIFKFILPVEISKKSCEMLHSKIRYARNNLCTLFAYREPVKPSEVIYATKTLNTHE